MGSIVFSSNAQGLLRIKEQEQLKEIAAQSEDVYHFMHLCDKEMTLFLRLSVMPSYTKVIGVFDKKTMFVFNEE